MPEQFQVAVATITSTSFAVVLSPSTAATHVLRTLTLCNSNTANTTSATVALYMSSGSATYTLFRYTQISTSQTMLPLVSPVVISAGNRLDVAGGVSPVDVSATYLELT